MSSNDSLADIRKTRQLEAINSGFKLYMMRAPTDVEIAACLDFLSHGGTLTELLADLRSADLSRVNAGIRAVPGIRAVDHPINENRKNVGRGLRTIPSATAKVHGKRVAIVSTYPPEPPQHGGQHRLRNIGRAYTRAGFAVRHVGVLGGSAYGPTPGFAAFPGLDEIKKISANPLFMEDWTLGQIFGRAGPYLDQFIESAGPLPDLIHVEQPWLFQMAKRWAASDSRRAVRIVYGSQNIESTLKAKIVQTYFGSLAGADAHKKVLDVELAATREADAVLAVSNEDCDWLERFRTDKVILAANGVAERETTISGLKEANHISWSSKFALICASAHPPNISSMFEIFGNGFACFSPRERLVLAGGIGPALRADSRYPSNTSLHAFVSDGGIVSEECIQGLLETAHAILLPITSGEGSNLKTAEALWAGKHIIATKTALRGFENFAASQGLVVVDEPKAFLHAVRHAMSKPPMLISAEERNRRRALLWENTLSPMTRWALAQCDVHGGGNGNE